MGDSLVAQLVKNPLAMLETPVRFWVGKNSWRRDRLITPVLLGFPGGSEHLNVGDLGLIPGLGRSLGEGHGNLLQYSCLENPYGQRRLAGCSPWACRDSTWPSNYTQHSIACTVDIRIVGILSTYKIAVQDGWSQWYILCMCTRPINQIFLYAEY